MTDSDTPPLDVQVLPLREGLTTTIVAFAHAAGSRRATHILTVHPRGTWSVDIGDATPHVLIGKVWTPLVAVLRNVRALPEGEVCEFHQHEAAYGLLLSGVVYALDHRAFVKTTEGSMEAGQEKCAGVLLSPDQPDIPAQYEEDDDGHHVWGGGHVIHLAS